MKVTVGEKFHALPRVLGILLVCLFAIPLIWAEDGKPTTMPQGATPGGWLDGIQMTRDSFQVQGWAGSDLSENPVVGIAVYLRDLKWDSLVDLEIYNGGFQKSPRPDVAEFMKRPDWTESGFTIQSEISPPLKPGVYEIWSAGILKNGERFSLGHSIEPVRVKRFHPDSIVYKFDRFFKGNFLASWIFWLSVLIVFIACGLLMLAFFKLRTRSSEHAKLPARREEMPRPSPGFSQKRQVLDGKIPRSRPSKDVVVDKPDLEPVQTLAAPPEVALVPIPLKADVRLKSIRKEMSHVFANAQKQIRNDALPLIGLDKNKKILILPEKSAAYRWFFIGDIHGDFFALHHLLEKAKEAPNFRVCFLGDLVNGGHYDLECFALLLQTAMENPDRILWIAGDHDEALDYNPEGQKKFSSKLEMGFFADGLNAPDRRRNPDKVESWGRLFMEIVADLPRAVLFPDGLLATHGGIPSDEKSPGLKSLEALNAPLVLKDFTCGRHSILPRKRKKKVSSQPAEQQMDSFFDHRDLEQFCNAVERFFPVKGLIRGHDHVEMGWQRSPGFKTFSILTINGFGFISHGASYEDYSEGLVLGVYRKNEAPDFEYVTFDETELAALAVKKMRGPVV